MPHRAAASRSESPTGAERPARAGVPRPAPCPADGAARAVEVRRLVARSVLHGAALRALLAGRDAAG